MSLITGIQKYSVHDGEGIRTTIFFKGCPLSCKWCHNPETQKYQKELYYDQDSCCNCQSCVTKCHNMAIEIVDNKVITNFDNCVACGDCLDACPFNLREIMGDEYKIDELVKEILKDQMFYEESNGGVTLSGGEVMSMPIDFIEELVKKIDRKGVSINIDTSGYCDFTNIEKILPYVDTFLYDLKMIDNEKHQDFIGRDNKLILDNLEKLSSAKAKINIRIPLIKEINADEKEIGRIIGFLKTKNIKVYKINLLPYHNIGVHKYAKISNDNVGLTYTTPTDEQMEEIIIKFNQNGFSNVKIGG